MTDFIWQQVARIVSRPAVASWLIRQAQKTPYMHLEGYMHRWWLFNPYKRGEAGLLRHRWSFPISIRVHHILREDLDRVLHDHPWNARTIILKGWYVEEREGHVGYARHEGDTARLRFGEFHRIRRVSPGGVYTLFITGRYRGTWGFKVFDRKVPYREYLARRGEE